MGDGLIYLSRWMRLYHMILEVWNVHILYIKYSLKNEQQCYLVLKHKGKPSIFWPDIFDLNKTYVLRVF